jgi:hypothetical protein
VSSAEKAKAALESGADHAIGRALGTLHHRVAQPTFALADIVAAHEAVEKGSIGNVVVRI